MALGILADQYPDIIKGHEHEVGWRMNADRSVNIILPDEIKKDKTQLNFFVKNKTEKEVTFE